MTIMRIDLYAQKAINLKIFLQVFNGATQQLKTDLLVGLPSPEEANFNQLGPKNF